MHAHLWILSLEALRVFLVVLCLSTLAFYAWSIGVAREFFTRPALPRCRDGWTGVSILKPIRGLDPHAAASFASFCRQDYPQWEILFGALEESDPGLTAVRQAERDHPEAPIRIVIGDGTPAANPKVRTLTRLAREARYPLLLISDSDIRVDANHLRRMVEPFDDPRVGVVTCLYRTDAETLWGRLDALSLSTEFIPGALAARRLEGMTFAMGSGILIRRDVLEKIGGLEAVGSCLADDYLLGNLPARAGHRVELAREVVDHRLGTRSLTDLIHRQIRWNLGIRSSRPWSYAGMMFMQGTAAAMLLPLVCAGAPAAWGLAGATLAVRLGSAWILASRYLRDRSVPKLLWLVPLRDLLSTLIWLVSFFSRSVTWRGQRFRIGPGGRLSQETA
jgi:ceramide glucosyltransferase